MIMQHTQKLELQEFTRLKTGFISFSQAKIYLIHWIAVKSMVVISVVRETLATSKPVNKSVRISVIIF
jgi:hypothetical protein